MRTRSLSNMHFGVTGIENMIISEYLVGLNEDEIKVYLYALMLSNTKEVSFPQYFQSFLSFFYKDHNIFKFFLQLCGSYRL